MKDNVNYGSCDVCGCGLSPVWFEEIEEIDKKNQPRYVTGRVRMACSYLFCENCGRKYMVDDTFDGPWYYEKGE